MPYGDIIILAGVGGFILIIGVVAVIWGKKEERGYYDSLSARRDVREYMEHWPPRAEPGSIKIGGWIAVAVGLVALAVSGALRLWG